MSSEPKPDPLEATLFIRKLPRDLKDRFKSVCARRGLTMTGRIIQMMQDTVKQEDQLEIRRRTKGSPRQFPSRGPAL